MKQRKRVTMQISVSVPRDMTAAEARREVRSLIKDGCGWSYRWDAGDVKPISVRPLGKGKRK